MSGDERKMCEMFWVVKEMVWGIVRLRCVRKGLYVYT